MGYSRNVKTLEKIRPLLRELEEGRSCEWTTNSDAFQLAYKIREALHLARVNSTRYPALARAAESFTIEVAAPQLVRAVPKRYGVQPSANAAASSLPNGKLPPQEGFLANTGRQSVMSIIQAWHDGGSQRETMHFPNAHLSRDELIQLHKWITERNWLMFEADGSVTLRRHSEDLADFAWTPEDIEE